ncbi:MAG: hypothetical protein ACM3JL_00485, partial [Nitrososphaerota archaeon]
MRCRRGAAWQRAAVAVATACLLCGALWAAPAAGAATCPNEELRRGPSANLPDCRAYELITPPDSNGRRVEGLSTFGFSFPYELFPTELSTPSRDSYIFMTYNSPLLEPNEPNGNFDVYESRREAAGWQVARRLSPSGPQGVVPTPGGVSADHRYTFTNVAPFEGGAHPGGSLAAEGTTSYLGKPDGSFELTGTGSLGSEHLVQGRYISATGEHVIFTTGKEFGQSIWCFGQKATCPVAKLEPDAPPSGTGAIYDRQADGPTHVVSLLPGN